MKKTRSDWMNEADNFICNWFCTSDDRREPSKDDVLEEVKSIEGIENPQEYAETLWGYIDELLRESEDDEDE